MQKAMFKYQSLAFDYVTYGFGSEVILCFHGFGRVSEDFELFASLLRPHQRIISISLFAHGESLFPEERIDKYPLQPEEWVGMLEAFGKEMQFDRFHLVGYSMGGRVCLKTLELMPDKVRSLLLFATDGLKVNWLYRFASGTKLGKALYRRLMNNPNAIFKTADILLKLKLLHPKLHRFTYVHMDTYAKRRQVYEAWLIYKLFFPNLKKLGASIREKELPFHMVFGKHDSVIPPHLGERFADVIGNRKHLHIITSGHRILTPELIRWVNENNLWPK